MVFYPITRTYVNLRRGYSVLNLILQRLLQTVVVVFIVTIITFSFMHIMPGDPAAMGLGPESEPEEN